MLQQFTPPPPVSVGANKISTALPDPLAPVSAIGPIRAAIDQSLAPIVGAIDLDGEYPGDAMKQLGAAGAFQQAVSPQFGGVGVTLRGAIQAIEEVSKDCLSTGFIVWCQIACTWYLQNTHNQALKAGLLPRVAAGQVMAGTGLSNPMKYYAGIETMALTATSVDGGYVLNGRLPWVSNLGPGHYFGVVAQTANTASRIMAIVSDAIEGVTLRRCGQFIALEGTGTFPVCFGMRLCRKIMCWLILVKPILTRFVRGLS